MLILRIQKCMLNGVKWRKVDILVSRLLLTSLGKLCLWKLHTREMASLNPRLGKCPLHLSSLFLVDFGDWSFLGSSGNKLAQETWQSLCPGIIHSKLPFIMPLFFTPNFSSDVNSIFIEFSTEEWEKREKETLICCSSYLCIRWLILVCTLARNQTQNLGVMFTLKPLMSMLSPHILSQNGPVPNFKHILHIWAV